VADIEYELEQREHCLAPRSALAERSDPNTLRALDLDFIDFEGEIQVFESEHSKRCRNAPCAQPSLFQLASMP
jgi:hypothetical protein